MLCGHDHDYERSFPVRGFDIGTGTSAPRAPVDTRRPHPVTTADSGVFDTSQGTVHLILGCGGTDANLDAYGVDRRPGGADPGEGVHPRNRPVPSATAGVYVPAGRRRGGGRDLVGAPRHLDRLRDRGVRREPWQEAGGQTSITVTHYHAVGADPVNPLSGEPGAPTGDYTQFETFTLVRPRSDGRRWHAKQSASAISG